MEKIKFNFLIATDGAIMRWNFDGEMGIEDDNYFYSESS